MSKLKPSKKSAVQRQKEAVLTELKFRQINVNLKFAQTSFLILLQVTIVMKYLLLVMVIIIARPSKQTSFNLKVSDWGGEKLERDDEDFIDVTLPHDNVAENTELSNNPKAGVKTELLEI